MNVLHRMTRSLVRLSPFNRFLFGFAVTFVISLSWPATLYLDCGSCNDVPDAFAKLLKHEQTFTTAHHLFFAPAIGLFLAAVSESCIQTVGKRSLFVLAVLMILASALAWQDAFTGPLGSHQMKDSCRFLKLERDLRKQFPSLTDPLPPEIDSFEKSRTVNGIRDYFAKSNLKSKVAAMLTWVFLVFPAIFIWYSWTSLFSSTLVIRKHLQLVVVALLLIPWIPLRIYADYYGNHWIRVNWMDAPAVFGLLISLLMTLFFATSAFLAYVRAEQRELAASICGALAAFVSFILTIVPSWAPRVEVMVDQLTPLMVFTFLFVGAALILAIAHLALNQKVENVA